MATIRKHLVNAFENVGERYGWDDGLKTPYTARRQGFKRCASGRVAWRLTTCRRTGNSCLTHCAK